MAIQSSFKNMVVVLSLVCLAAAAVLGGVYALTKEPIDAAQVAKINNAIGGVVPEFTNDPFADKYEVEMEGKKFVVYPAVNNGSSVGYAIESFTTKGFGGKIVLMVGFTASGEIKGVSVISHAETPGLGAKITDPSQPFVTQFQGKNPADPNFKFAVKKDGGNLDAITASTITSRAFLNAVNAAYQAYKAEGGKVNGVSGASQKATGADSDTATGATIKVELTDSVSAK